MITIKSASQIEKMRAAGALLHDVLQTLRAAVQPGVTTLELDRLAEKRIREAGAIPSFKGFEGFPFSICASVDDQVVHGFATKDRLREGQILSIDCGVILNGWQSDSALTVPVGHISPEAAAGGPIALIQDGDQITVDIEGGAITLHVDDDELAARRAAFVAPAPKHNHGVLAKYAKLVSSADKGAYVS